MWLFEWLRSWQRRQDERGANWESAIRADSEGWSKFQRYCQEELVRTFGSDLNGKEVPRQSPEGASLLIGRIPGRQARFWLYLDGAQVEGRATLEHWDFDTPEALVTEFVAEVAEEMQSNKSLNSDAGKAGAG